MNWLFFAITKGKDMMSRVQRKTTKLADHRAMHGRAVVIVDRWIQMNFRGEGDLAHDGDKWVPLKSATIKRRRKEGRGAKILQDTGTLRLRWKHLYTPWKVAVQSGVDYGIYHDEGRGHLPERRILPKRSQVAGKIKAAYSQYIKEALSS